MTLSNQSHFPGFFLSPESHLKGFCKSHKTASQKEVISEILKLLKMVLCFSREIVSFKNVKNLAGLTVFYSGSNESSLAPQFKWLDNSEIKELEKNARKLETFLAPRLATVNGRQKNKYSNY
jgi:hypothetical protein